MLSKTGTAEIFSLALGLVTYALHLKVRHPSGTPAIHSHSVSHLLHVYPAWLLRQVVTALCTFVYIMQT